MFVDSRNKEHYVLIHVFLFQKNYKQDANC